MFHTNSLRTDDRYGHLDGIPAAGRHFPAACKHFPAPGRQFEAAGGRIPAAGRRIEAAARHLLHQSHFVAIRNVKCSFDGRVLALHGRVPRYYEKQIAQSLILRRLHGAIILDNQLVVAPESEAGTLDLAAHDPAAHKITYVVRQQSMPLLEPCLPHVTHHS